MGGRIFQEASLLLAQFRDALAAKSELRSLKGKRQFPELNVSTGKEEPPETICSTSVAERAAAFPDRGSPNELSGIEAPKFGQRKQFQKNSERLQLPSRGTNTRLGSRNPNLERGSQTAGSKRACLPRNMSPLPEIGTANAKFRPPAEPSKPHFPQASSAASNFGKPHS